MIPDKGTLTIYKFNSDTVIQHLTNEQAGRLFKAILLYGNNGEQTVFSDDGMVSMMFDLYRKGIDELDEKYRVQRQKKKEAGHKGGVSKRSNAKQTEATLSNAKQTEEKKTDFSNRSIYVDVYGDGDGDGDGDGNREEELNNNIPDTFEKILAIYPFKDSNSKDRSCREYINRIREGWEPEQLLKAAEHYKAQCDQEETEKKYIIRPWNFYGDKKPFIDYIEINEGNNNADENRGLYAVRDNFFG